MVLERLQQLLETLDRASAAALLDAEGRPLEAVGELDGIDLERLAAAMTEQARAAAAEQHPLTAGELGRFVVATDLYTVFLAPVTDRHYLLLVVEAGGNDGRARFEGRRACRDLRAEAI